MPLSFCRIVFQPLSSTFWRLTLTLNACRWVILLFSYIPHRILTWIRTTLRIFKVRIIVIFSCRLHSLSGTLPAPLSGTFLRRKDVVNQCLELHQGSLWTSVECTEFDSGEMRSKLHIKGSKELYLLGQDKNSKCSGSSPTRQHLQQLNGKKTMRNEVKS